MTMDKEVLYKTLSVQSASYKNEVMMEYISDCLTKMKVQHYRDQKGNLYGVKGKLKKDEFYPCVVAHTDTVHDIHPSYAIFDINGYCVAFNGPDQVGTGGDDKVGIFMALELIRLFPVMKVAFFVDEEVGCQGSRAADKTFFDDVAYALQADRRGNKDIIDKIGGKKLCSDEFKKAMAGVVAEYKREWCSGMTTDVGALADSVPVSMMNMSCGYFEPHSKREYVNVQDVENTFNFMRDTIKVLGNVRYECDHKYSYSTYNSWDNHSSTGGYVGNGRGHNHMDDDYWTKEFGWLPFKDVRWCYIEKRYKVRSEAVRLAVIKEKREELSKKHHWVTIPGGGAGERLVKETGDDFGVTKDGFYTKFVDGRPVGKWMGQKYVTVEDWLGPKGAAFSGSIYPPDIENQGGEEEAEEAVITPFEEMCPLCEGKSDSMYDDTATDFFCMSCNMYHQDIAKFLLKPSRELEKLIETEKKECAQYKQVFKLTKQQKDALFEAGPAHDRHGMYRFHEEMQMWINIKRWKNAGAGWVDVPEDHWLDYLDGIPHYPDRDIPLKDTSTKSWGANGAPMTVSKHGKNKKK